MSTSFQHIMPITFDSGEEGPHLLILAGVHGDELEPVQVGLKLTTQLAGAIKIRKGTLTIVPIVNRPAYKNKSRTAEDGLDLARTFPGRKEGSKTEQIAWEISQLIRSVDFLIDMHTGGKTYEIYPLSGYVLHRDEKILEIQRAMATTFGLPVQWGTSPELNGRTLSVARDAGIPAIYTEYGGGGQQNEEIVEVLYKGCLRVLVELKMIPDRKMHSPEPQYIVEDAREASGHLQIMYPSPLKGDFITHAQLGAMVKKGDLIGEVHDSKTGKGVEISAREDGLLFLIRRRPFVNKNEATAGILPITQPGTITLP